jgi:hypothetical protein
MINVLRIQDIWRREVGMRAAITNPRVIFFLSSLLTGSKPSIRSDVLVLSHDHGTGIYIHSANSCV